MSRKTPLLFLFLLTMLGSLIFGCSSATPTPEPGDEAVTEAREAALLEGFTPLAGPFETVANFDPMMGDSPENIIITEINGHTYAFITSLLNGSILRVDMESGEYVRIPIADVPEGSFMAGIDKMPDGRLVFVYSAFGQYGPIGSWVKTLDPVNNAVGDLAYIPNIALNGAAVYGESLYSVDPFSPDGLIWKTTLENGDTSVWVQNAQLSPDFGYIPTPCNPPMPVGMNGLRLRIRPAFTYNGVFHPTAFMVSNTTRSNIMRVDINPDGSAGEVAEVFSNVPYPDDIWTSRYCGDVIVAHHGLQISSYVNAFGTTTEMTTEPICDGPTALYAYNGELIVICGGDGLICREGAPTPRIVKAPLIPWLDQICQYSANLN